MPYRALQVVVDFAPVCMIEPGMSEVSPFVLPLGLCFARIDTPE